MLLHSGLLLILLNRFTAAFECYRNAGDYDYEVQYCNPQLQPLCLKADAFNGKTYRDCATLEQCPQGSNACAPITYDEDSTTDYVCCCSTPYCNSANLSTVNPLVIISLMSFIVLLFKRT
ncbi:hypothetical protein M3Y98_01145800 [Aphelenchoides besseyi]|nr:hypothetical protein M3Y98_01145800 [Aphelenchoides besseyi]KAI6210732.1 hypothetical protein M3Y96_00359100 [Aphelenchoides besseyi]